MWFSLVCILIDSDARHHSGQLFCGVMRRNILMTRIVVDKNTDHAKPHSILLNRNWDKAPVWYEPLSPTETFSPFTCYHSQPL